MDPLDFQLVEGPSLSIKFQSCVVQHAHSVLEGPVLLDPGTQRLEHILFQVIGLQTALMCGSPRSVNLCNHWSVSGHAWNDQDINILLARDK